MFYFWMLFMILCLFMIVLLAARMKDMQQYFHETEAQAEYIQNLQTRTINQLRDTLKQMESSNQALQREIASLQKQFPTASTSNKIETRSSPVSTLEAPTRASNAPLLTKQQNMRSGGVSTLKVVSVINYKGGVGKTTVTSNIATHVASKGKRVLMIDLDPQTNLTLSFMNNEEWVEKYAEEKTLKNFFQPILEGAGATTPLESLVISLDVKGITMDLISSHLELINVDTELAACLGGGNEALLRRNYLTVHNHLRDGIKALKKKYDLILIDCPPSFNTVVKNALTASDFYLVPAKMDYLSTLGIDQLDRNSRKYVAQHNERAKLVGKPFSEIAPVILGVIPAMVTLYGGVPVQANQQYIDRVRNKGYYLFPHLRENTTLYAPAPNNGIPAILAQGTTAASDGIVEELKTLSEDFIRKAGI